MVYVHIGSVFILPESMSQSLCCRPVRLRQHRDCDGLREYEHTTNLNISHVLYLISTLSPFLFIQSLYICLFLKIHRIFYLLVGLINQICHLHAKILSVLKLFSWNCTVFSLPAVQLSTSLQ